MLCTTRFDPSLETFDWNNAPDGSPSPYLLLSYQLDRLISCSVSLDYTTLKDICDKAVSDAGGMPPLKIRIVFSSSGHVTASVFPVEPLRRDPTALSRFTPGVPPPAPILSICIDTRPTSGTVSMKTTHRKPYDEARARVGIPPLGDPRDSSVNSIHPDDVLLFNFSGAIMESSICNVAFYRHGRWITPPLTVGCISGVFRRWLLENGRIYEADEYSLSLNTINDNEYVLLFNGVSGCRLGRIHRDRDVSEC